MTPIFSFKKLTHFYGKHRTLDIDFLDIAEGSLACLAGPNGSGKSTLLKIAACLLPRSGGEFLYGGVSVDARSARTIRREVTLLLQDPFLLKRSVRENIAFGLRLRGLSRSEIEERACESLSRVGLDFGAFAGRPWFRLSGGEASRVALAVRLALRPRVLLLDEPTASVDEESAALIKTAVMRERSERGTTVIIATHDASWLHGRGGMPPAPRIISMERGRITGDELTASAAALYHRSSDGVWSEKLDGLALDAGETVTLLGEETSSDASDGLCAGKFRANIVTRGLDIALLRAGDTVSAGSAMLEITQVGKRCYPECALVRRGDGCGLRDACAFAEVRTAGRIDDGGIIRAARSVH